MMQINLRQNLVVNDVVTPSCMWLGGKGFFTAEAGANWGGGSVALQMQTPHGTWVPVKNPNNTTVSLGADGGLYFELPPGLIRAAVTTATTVYSYAVGIHQ